MKNLEYEKPLLLWHCCLNLKFICLVNEEALLGKDAPLLNVGNFEI